MGNKEGLYIKENITVYMIDFDALSKGVKETCVPCHENSNASSGVYLEK